MKYVPSVMKNFRVLQGSLFLLLFSVPFQDAESFDPFSVSTGVAAGAAAFTSAFFAGFNLMKCSFGECCLPEIKPNMSGLLTSLDRRLHGQPLVKDTVVKLLTRHLAAKDPERALVLSFHGWTGSGKNFVSRLIAEHIYDCGMKNEAVQLFVSTVHFPHKKDIEEYQDNLRQWIRGNVSQNERIMFIFDEMDKMPEGLLDAIKPYLDTYPTIDGVNYRKSIFLFLSNTAGHRINQRTLEHWQAGRKRTALTRKEMEIIISQNSFNEKGGLWHSSLIEKNLISAFIPFLPLERHHVKLCVLDDLRSKNINHFTDDQVNEILDELTYFPVNKNVFSQSGCKRVAQKVDLIME